MTGGSFTWGDSLGSFGLTSEFRLRHCCDHPTPGCLCAAEFQSHRRGVQQFASLRGKKLHTSRRAITSASSRCLRKRRWSISTPKNSRGNVRIVAVDRAEICSLKIKILRGVSETKCHAQFAARLCQRSRAARDHKSSTSNSQLSAQSRGQGRLLLAG
jgi:hypothetical protein